MRRNRFIYLEFVMDMVMMERVLLSLLKIDSINGSKKDLSALTQSKRSSILQLRKQTISSKKRRLTASTVDVHFEEFSQKVAAYTPLTLVTPDVYS